MIAFRWRFKPLSTISTSLGIEASGASNSSLIPEKPLIWLITVVFLIIHWRRWSSNSERDLTVVGRLPYRTVLEKAIWRRTGWQTLRTVSALVWWSSKKLLNGWTLFWSMTWTWAPDLDGSRLLTRPVGPLLSIKKLRKKRKEMQFIQYILKYHRKTNLVKFKIFKLLIIKGIFSIMITVLFGVGPWKQNIG